MGLGTQAHFSKNGPGERQNWKNQQRNGRGEAGRTAVTDKTLSPVTGDSGSEPISVLSRPVGKHSLRDLRSCPWQLSPSPQLLPPGPVKSRAWGEALKKTFSAATLELIRGRAAQVMQEQGAVADRTAVCKDALGRIVF